MQDTFDHLWRTLLMYVLVYLVMRMMGKREIGKLSVFDLVISIMIAEIAVFALEDIQRPIFHSIFMLVILLVLQIFTAWLSLKSRKARLLFDGKPSVLISKGKINRKEMGKQRYNLDDLMLQLREQNVDSISNVEFAILETTGKLTVIPKDESADQKDPAKGQSNSLSRPNNAFKQERAAFLGNFKYEGLPIPLIMDGKVQDKNLEVIDKTRFWLKSQIQKQGIRDFKDVFLCSMDHTGKIYINKKEKS
ncbi:DUF421 domain-containing protein [Paenibacillus sp. JX-17]|uniref:DUF421 domain-containing protein n=1 Tax=Paenibacillus lacisoli TaxID=3064525 RepID=A0ABT9CFM8_9BACL|nr:DUF421 domain-containing protein [Paenibacillus sp. JX-17]MDO7908084.1 DUF421 domain-containing protein [Paenibacillus sp. JX-17]